MQQPVLHFLPRSEAAGDEKRVHVRPVELGSTVKPACVCTARMASAMRKASSSGSKRRATESTP
jgi:hypothetical protein